MALDPNRWTLKTQEAVNTAIAAARSASNPEVTPDHLLLALLGQEEGIVLPILQKVGMSPLQVQSGRGRRLQTSQGLWQRVAHRSRLHRPRRSC